jgi:hypothetical protein
MTAMSNYSFRAKGTTMEDKMCPVFLDGKECGFPLTPVDLEAEKIGSDLATYECGLGHRSYFLREPKTKSQTLSAAVSPWVVNVTTSVQRAK